jgi:hypothetical protein
MLRSPPMLPNGAPGQRLRHLAGHLHSLGPRALHGFLEELIDGKMPDGLAVVQSLERHARFPLHVMKAINGYALPSPVFDLTWVIESDRRTGRPPRPRGRPRRPPSSRGALRLVPPLEDEPATAPASSTSPFPSSR